MLAGRVEAETLIVVDEPESSERDGVAIPYEVHRIVRAKRTGTQLDELLQIPARPSARRIGQGIADGGNSSACALPGRRPPA